MYKRRCEFSLGSQPSLGRRVASWSAFLHGFRMAGGWVYILCNKPHGVLYTGVTADLARRVWQHRSGEGGRFTRKHHCFRLVYVEPHDRIEDAIAREKAIKAWLRVWKLRLIQEHNPLWEDLWERIAQ